MKRTVTWNFVAAVLLAMLWSAAQLVYSIGHWDEFQFVHPVPVTAQTGFGGVLIVEAILLALYYFRHAVGTDQPRALAAGIGAGGLLICGLAPLFSAGGLGPQGQWSFYLLSLYVPLSHLAYGVLATEEA